MTEFPHLAPPDEGLSEILAAVGGAVQAVGQVEMALVVVASRIVHEPPLMLEDIPLASLMVFSQASIERRIDIVRKLAEMRLTVALSSPRHSYHFKVAEFLLSSFTAYCSKITDEVWIRNLAAHGTVFVPQEPDRPTLVPSIFDLPSQSKFYKKRKSPDNPSRFPHNGFTPPELQDYKLRLARITGGLFSMADLFPVPVMGIPDSPEFESKLIGLGRDLGRKPPLRERPHRGKRD